MSPEICPSLFNIVPDKETEPYPEIFLNIFTFGQPVYVTRNLNYLEELIKSTYTQTIHKHKGTIDFEITHIKKEFENLLSVSLRDGYLYFNPS